MFKKRFKPLIMLLWIAALLICWRISLRYYLAFHAFSEIFSIVIGASISIIAFHTRRIHKNNFLMVIGTSFVFVSLLDLLHLLTFKGMGIFNSLDANMPTQFWVTARTFQIASFLIALAMYKKPIAEWKLITFYSAAAGALTAAVLSGVFPRCYDESLNRLTMAKIVIESIICLLATGCFWTVYKSKIQLSLRLRQDLLFSLAFFVLSEFSFCLYFDVYGFFNFAGHIFKILAFYYLYSAIIKAGLSRPYKMLFLDLSTARKNLERMNQELERKVQERTAVSEMRANQLRELAAELVMAEQREKKKLAHLLHDHLQQLLVAAKMRLSILKKYPQANCLQESADEIAGLINQSIQCSRELSVELSPPALNSGLTAGLNWLVEWFEQKYSFSVEFNSKIKIRNELPEEINYFVFSAARELLFNVVKHAKVKTANLRLSYRRGMLYLAIKDKGAGIDTSILTKKNGGGFGLFSIKERIELLNGEMKIKSSPGKGMTSLIRIPVAIRDAENLPQATNYATTADTFCKKRKIRVIIADDHHLMRQGLGAMLEPHEDIEIVAYASNGEDAIKLVSEHKPDVVIMDIDMPKISGIEAARQISLNYPQIRVIGLSTHDSKQIRQEMLEAGASDYCTKYESPDVLVKAIRNN